MEGYVSATILASVYTILLEIIIQSVILFFSGLIKMFIHVLLFCFTALVHPDNHMMGFLSYSAMDAIKAIELPRGEFLLIFQSLGIFVDSQGRKSRDREIMYPSDLIDASKLCFFIPYLIFNI